MLILEAYGLNCREQFLKTQLLCISFIMKVTRVWNWGGKIHGRVICVLG